MNSSKLKMIACLAMLLDHVAMVLIDSDTPVHLVMRVIGRIAFPIFAFLIAEGFFHTRSVYKYMSRLLLFAVISEVPFDMAQGDYFDFSNLNIFFTLFLGLLSIHLFHKMRGSASGPLLVFAICVIAEFLSVDYSMYGVLTVFIFYYFRANSKKQFYVFGSMTALLVASSIMVSNSLNIGYFIQLFAVVSLLLIKRYNGEKGINMKYLFYAFYPGHLLILGLIRMYVL